jgi:TolA-binding protein
LNFNFAKSLAALGVALALAGPASAPAQSRREIREYGAGTNQFARGQNLMAEVSLSLFVNTYTNSTLRTNAVLFLAQSRIALSNYTGALSLLQREMPSGKREAEFVFWMARAYYEDGKYSNTIERCSYLLEKLTAEAPLPLRATLLQARAQAKLTNWPGVSGLLATPNGEFQAALQRGLRDQDVMAGYFLLGEAYLNQQQHKEAEVVIGKINPDSLTPELQWQRQYLLCRVWLEEGRREEALAGGGNLPALVARSGQEQRIATAFLLGAILERTGQISGAIQAYSTNLDQGFPDAVKRQALGKTIELMLSQNQPSNTMLWLDSFIQQRTNEPMLDLARFHLGDLQLHASFALPEPGTNGAPAADTNLLRSASNNLEQVILHFPGSQLLGRAFLDCGWCDWAQGNFAGAVTNFSQAEIHLPFSEYQAVALLKWGDACFALGDYTNAANHYNQLIQDYATMPGVTNELFDLALYQLVQAQIKLGNAEAARAAEQRLFALFPISLYGQKSLLLLGEDASKRKTNTAEARRTFQSLLEKFPDTPLWPQTQLAIARTYEQEGDWTNVFSAYTNLEGNPHFASNALRPQVEFSLALACWHAGLESNALARMSNFVSEFTNDVNAPLAQNWIGNFHLNHGNYADADYDFQKLYTKYTKAGDLAWQARLMAGLAARNNQDYSGASNEFYLVATDTNAPAPFLALGRFQFGYTLFQQYQHNSTNGDLLRTAIHFLSEVTNSGPTNLMAILALGQLGNCDLAWADQNKTNAAAYTDAILVFQSVLQDTNETPADVTARSQAEFGLGLVAERLHQQEQALGHYGNVLYAVDTARADPVWVKEAGVKAAAWYEERHDWTNAIKVYQRVREVVPSLAKEMQRNIDRINAAAPGH